MIGQYVQPRPMQPVAGQPPATPQDAQGLKDRWMHALSNPALQSGLFQMGASLLANAGRGNFVNNIGVALGDAGGAAGRTQRFITETDQANRQLSQGDQRLGLEGQRVAQDAAQGERQGRYQDRSLALQGRQLDASTANNQAELTLREKELMNNASYRNASLALQREQVAASTAAIQTPKGRALQSLLKSAQDNMALDPNFDMDTYIDSGMQVIDRMFGGNPAAAPGGIPAAPAPVAPGAPATPGAPASAAPPPEAVQMLKNDKSPNAAANFDAIFGQGAAAKALGGGTPAPAAVAPVPGKKFNPQTMQYE